jgi:hypothetical protein
MVEPLRMLIPGTLRIGTYFQLLKRNGRRPAAEVLQTAGADSLHSRRDLASMHLRPIDFVCLTVPEQSSACSIHSAKSVGRPSA